MKFFNKDPLEGTIQRLAENELFEPDPRASEHWKPLTEQLKELFSSYTPSMRARHFSISELLPHLYGHYRLRPSRGDVRQALKALGWVPSRDWSVQGGSGRRVWILSDTD